MAWARLVYPESSCEPGIPAEAEYPLPVRLESSQRPPADPPIRSYSKFRPAPPYTASRSVGAVTCKRGSGGSVRTFSMEMRGA